MKGFLKENLIQILFLFFIGLIFILWGRIFAFKLVNDVVTKNLYTTESRVRCAESFGWQVDETSETEENIYIPEEFDDVYKRYNHLQKVSGYDLYKYRGKGVKRYIFRTLNFPGNDETEAFLNLLVYDGKLIGGDCMAIALDGFMLPLNRKFVD